MESQDMIARNASWTLACDNELLNRLKAFSEKLTENSQEISKECDTLSTDVTQLNYKLLNLTNEFLMLSNTQFVENRVEEFEEFSASVSSNSGNATVSFKTKTEKEAELISKMKQAIQTGLTACNERKVQNGSSVNRFKLKRPHLIGSPKFFSSKFCGLVDESRRIVPSDRISLCDSDTVSLGQISDNDFMRPDPKPVVTFTMPPQAVYPAQVSSNVHDQHQSPETTSNDYQISRTSVVPASPSNSNKSSEIMPRSITDDLNKIYSSFAPPPNAGLLDDDSDDDFKPSASGGRLFDDDDNDLFGEKELFPSSGQKNSDFFGRSNPSKTTAAPVFTVPPPVQSHPVQLPQPTFVGEQTLVGPQPKTNVFPNTCDVTSQNGALIHDAEKSVPETEGPSRAKRLPGAVSMFGGLPPPVFNDDGILQPSESYKNTTAQFQTKQDTQNSSASSNRSGTSLLNDRDNTRPSQPKQADLHTDVQSTSQPRSSLFSSGISRAETESISRGSLSGSGDVSRVSRKAPVSSLFVDDSSDEDIFSAAKKQTTQPQVIRNSASENNLSAETSQHSSNNLLSAATAAQKREEPKYLVKKSIFEDSESEDDLFSTKQTVVATNKNSVTDKKASTYVAPKISRQQKVGKSALFSEESDSDTDLFGNKKPVKSSFYKESTAMDTPDVATFTQDSVTDGNEVLEKDTIKSINQLTPDDVDAAVVSDKTTMPGKKKIIGDPKLTKSKSFGSKISEKIKAMENTKTRKQDDPDASNESDINDADKPAKPTKSKLSVKTLALSLNINPLAMKGGAKPPKPGQVSSVPSTPEQETNTSPVSNENNETSSSYSNAVPNNLEDTTNEKEPESTTPTSSVKSLAKSLNFNPLAMKVGAKPPKPGQISSAPSTPEQETNNLPVSNENNETPSSYSNAVPNNLEDTTNEKEPESPTPSVKSLAKSLNFNPLAMKVGAKPPKPGQVSSAPSTPEQETNTLPVSNENNETSSSYSNAVPNNLEDTTSEKEPDGVAPFSRDGEDQFFRIIKTRAKIQQKRRPPSRVFLKALAGHSSIDKDETEVDDGENSENIKSSDVSTEISTNENAFTDETLIISSESVENTDLGNSVEKSAGNESPVSVHDQDIVSVEEQSDGEIKENPKTASVEDVEETMDDIVSNVKAVDRDSKGSLPAEDSDEDLFSSKVERKSSQPNTQHAAEGTSKSSSQTSKVVNHNSKKSIFEDSDSDTDLFATKSSKVNNNNDDDSLFSTKPNKPKLETVKKVSTLFGDDSDSDSDLFKSKPTISHKKKPGNDETSESSAAVKILGGKSSFFDSSDEN